MRAIIQSGYGSPSFLKIIEKETPSLADDEMLVKVSSVSLNAGDYYTLMGRPYLTRLFAGFPKPKNYTPGMDFSGQIIKVGSGIKRFRIGDEVFGSSTGTLADFVKVKEKSLAPKPENLNHEEAAAVPTAGVTALIGISNVGKVKTGDAVLINGASGGVGTFAVQIAKALGAKVSVVCSTRNIDLLASLGADKIIDYTKEDFTKGLNKYDIILDQVANHSLSEFRKVLKEKGKYIPNSGEKGLPYITKSFFSSIVNKKQSKPFIAITGSKELLVLKELIENNKIYPVIDMVYPLKEITRAFEHLSTRHVKGKIIVKISSN